MVGASAWGLGTVGPSGVIWCRALSAEPIKGGELLTARGGGTLAEPLGGQAPIGTEGGKALVRLVVGQAPLGAGGGTMLVTFGKTGARGLATLAEVPMCPGGGPSQ